GIDSLHDLVAPVPVAATVLDSPKKRGLAVATLSPTDTSAEQIKVVRPTDLTVIVIVRFMVPVKVVSAKASGLSSAAGGIGRNAPVRGSRYPRIPVWAWLLAA